MRTSNEISPCALRLLTPALSSLGEEREMESFGISPGHLNISIFSTAHFFIFFGRI
jgi:hypothetical protein